MKLIYLFSLLAGASIAQIPFNLEQIYFECKQQKCYLDLSFAESKFNPTITQKQIRPNVFSLELAHVQSKIKIDTIINIGGQSIHSLGIRNNNSQNTLEIKFNSIAKDLKPFSKISKSSEKTVRFELILKGEKNIATKLNLNGPVKNIQFASLPKANKSSPPKNSSFLLSSASEKVLFSHFLKSTVVKNEFPRTSKSFSLNTQIIPMTFISDANLYELPQENSKILTKASLGKMVERIQIKNNWVQVKTKSGILAYVERNKLAYTDELSQEQIQKISVLYSSNPEKKFDLSSESTKQTALISSLDSSKNSLIQNQEQTERFVYSSFGRRDPFIRVKLPEVDGLSIDDIQLVGIIWSDNDPIAIFEDKKMPDRSYSLRKGDPVMNGSVQKISQNSVIFNKNEFGVSRQFVMTLPKEQQ